jgi:WD40 repeat protein
VLDGHEEYIYEIAFSADGRLMATASGDNTAIVWDTATRRKLHVLEHEAAVYSARISPDGKAVATGCGDGQVTLWDPSNGQRIKQVQRHADAVYAVAFSPDGRLLASAGGSTDGGDAVCRILSAQSLEVVKELSGHERQVYGLVFSPDGKTLASGSSDKTVRLWDLESGKARVWRGHASDVYRGTFSPDGKRFATASQDGTIRLWAVDTGAVVGVFEAKPKDPFYTVAFSSDGSQLVVVGDDRRLRFLRASDLRPEPGPEELSDHALYAVALHPKTNLPAAAGEDGKIYLVPRPR